MHFTPKHFVSGFFKKYKEGTSFNRKLSQSDGLARSKQINCMQINCKQKKCAHVLTSVLSWSGLDTNSISA